MKVFGSDEPTDVRTVDFQVKLHRRGEPEVHTFRARPRVQGPAIKMVAKLSRGGFSGEVIDGALRMVLNQLDDTDGTPMKWSPEESRNGDPDNVYRGPDDRTYAFDDEVNMRRWLDPEEGSSRRRFNALLEDDEASIDIEQLVDILKWLISEAAERPTRRSASPSR